MKHMVRLFFRTLAASFLLLSLISCSGMDKYVTLTGFAQGGTWSAKFNLRGEDGRTRQDPEAIRASIDSILQAIDHSVSGYNKGSLLSRFNAGEKIVPDRIFSELYELSIRYSSLTDGRFDVSCGPLFDIWGFGFTSGSMPGPEQVQEVLARTGMDRLSPIMEADGEGRVSASALVAPGEVPPVLNYNAIAQGYSCDLVAEYLHGLGIRDMLVDVGGEIYCEGLNPAGREWSIGLDRPVDGNNVPGADLQGIFKAGPAPCGIVTSGNYRKFYVRDGKKYSHTIDPQTGYPVTHSLLSATIVCADAAAADALATACMVAGLDEAKAFISSTEGVEGYLVYAEGDAMKSWSSPGFSMSER